MSAESISLSPSSASRWLHCTASPTLVFNNRHKLPKESSDYSEEGKKAHAACAAGLLMGDEALVEACSGDKDMITHCRGYVKFVTSKCKPGDDVYIETEVPVWYYKGKRGYIDHARLNSKVLYITDLKYGEGLYVSARGNKQMAIYAMSMITTLQEVMDFPPDFLITMVIYQPRCRKSGDKPFSLWSVTFEELLLFVKHIADTAASILAGKEYTFAPSDDNCRFCRAVSICRARAQQLFGDNEDILPPKPDPLSTIYLKDPATLEAEELTFLLRNKSAIVSWLDKLQKYAYASVKSGAPELVGNHWKLVRSGDGNRVYIDAGKAAKFLVNHLPKEEVYPPSQIISPAQAEKRLADLYGKPIAKELIAEFTTRPPGGETLAPADDEREAINEDHAADFEDISNHHLL